MAEFVTVGRIEEIDEGEAKAFDIAGEQVAVALVDGVPYAFSDICTHRHCNLSNGGEIDGVSITCECHGSTFDMTTGAVLEGPATDPIATYPARDEGGELQVQV